MKAILNDLFEHKTLDRARAKEVLMNIASAKYNSGQVAAFMSVFLMRPITVEELSGFREAMLELCLRVDLNGGESIDIVGTGGDGKDTFNISTLSCFVVAGAGYRVTKHGNYGVSSVTGSSNVLEALGYKFTNDKDHLQKQLDKAGICFLHAPLFHPAMKTVAPIRKELGVRTFFNMLGPIVNPCFPEYQLLGVYSLEMARLYNYLLQQTDTRYVIVHSYDGYDEISLTGKYKFISRSKEEVMDPVKPVFASELKGGSSVEASAELFRNILHGKGTAAQNAVVAANAGAAIRCMRPQESHESCVRAAEESLVSGNALKVFNQLLSI